MAQRRMAEHRSTAFRRMSEAEASGEGRRALSGGVLYAIVFGFQTVIWLGVLSYLTRTISVSDFGRFALYNAAEPLLKAVIALGTSIALIRELAELKDPDARRVAIATTFWGRLVLGLPMALIFLVASALSPSPIRGELALLAGIFVVAPLTEAALDLLRIEQRHAHLGAIITVSGILQHSLVLFLVWKGFGVIGILWGDLLGAALTLGAILWARGKSLLLRPNPVVWKRLVKFGWPVCGYAFLRHGSALDRHLFAYRFDLVHTGIYQLACVPSGGIDLVESAAFMSGEPYLFRVAKQERRVLFVRLFLGLSLLLAFLAMLAGLASPEIVRVLGPAAYAPAVLALPWLTFASALRSTARVTCLMAAVNGETRSWFLVGAADLVFSFLFFVAMPVSLGTPGFAASRCVSAALTVILGGWFVKRTVGQTLPVFTAIAGTAAMLALSILATGLTGTPSPLWLRAGLAVVCSLGALTFGWRWYGRTLKAQIA
jgi:O-antigen/teichoic acid export membrane protein